MKKLIFALMIVMGLVSLTGCSLFGDDDDTSPIVTAVNPPASAAAFNGVKLSFNPTISFSSDGTVNDFSYSNNANDSSLFPTTGNTALTGKFTYSTVDSKRRRLDFAFTDSTKDFSIELNGFTGIGRAISAVQITKVGDTSNTAFQGQVIEGSLTGAEATAAVETPTTQETGTGGESTTTPASLQGKVIDLTFADAPVFTSTPKVPAGFPFKDGDILKFTFSSSSILTLGEDYRSIGLPKKYAGSPEIVWYDQVNKINFCVTLKEDGTLYKVNVRADTYKYSTDDTDASYYGMFYVKP